MAISEFAKIRKSELEAKGHDDFNGVDLLEALAATGLRSVRYLKEIPHVRKLLANDLLPTATELMKKNFDFNELDESKYESKHLNNNLG